LKKNLTRIKKDFSDYELKMKTKYFNDSESLLYDNDKLID